MPFNELSKNVVRWRATTARSSTNFSTLMPRLHPQCHILTDYAAGSLMMKISRSSWPWSTRTFLSFIGVPINSFRGKVNRHQLAKKYLLADEDLLFSMAYLVRFVLEDISGSLRRHPCKIGRAQRHADEGSYSDRHRGSPKGACAQC